MSGLKNLIVYGKKTEITTKIITMLREVLSENPDLQIGVCEEIENPQIKKAIGNIISVNSPSVGLDLFVCVQDYYMIGISNSMNIPVWAAIPGDKQTVKCVKKHIPCTGEFEVVRAMARRVTYEEKIDRILDNKLEYNGDHEKDIADVKAWLCCEWQCGEIEDMHELQRLIDHVDKIAEEKIKAL